MKYTENVEVSRNTGDAEPTTQLIQLIHCWWQNLSARITFQLFSHFRSRVHNLH